LYVKSLVANGEIIPLGLGRRDISVFQLAGRAIQQPFLSAAGDWIE
jgi:hypothetical protein